MLITPGIAVSFKFCALGSSYNTALASTFYLFLYFVQVAHFREKS